MEFKKNELINETLDKHFETWSHMLDTADFVPAKYLDKIDKYIFKLLKKKLKELEIYNLLYLQERGRKLGLMDKLKISFSGLKPLYVSENQTLHLQEEIDRLKKELKKVKSKRRSKNEEATNQ